MSPSPHPSRHWTITAMTLCGLVALPILTVCASFFFATADIWGHLLDTVFPRYVGTSLLLMLLVGGGVTVGGVGTAWLVTMCRLPGARWLEWALLLPMAMPAYVVAYTFTDLFAYAGPVQSTLRLWFGWRTAAEYWFPAIRSTGGAAAVLTLVLYPYVYMLARTAFLEQSVCVLEVARTLGRGPWRAFWSVAFPLARPAIVAGVALALMETLNDFGTVDYFAVDTLSTGIYRTWLGLGQPLAAAQLGAVLTGFVFLLLSVERWSRGQARFHHTTPRYRALPRLPLSPSATGLALLFCLLPIVLGFALPLLVLASWAWNSGLDRLLSRDFTILAGNSFLLACLSAVLAVSVALVLAYAQRLSPRPLTRALCRVAALGYAIPGSVIAVGILIPLTATDRFLSSSLRALTGWSPGLILTGTLVALIYAYLVRFLAVSLNGVEASLGKVTPSMEAAARTLGQTPSGTLRRVHLPILRGSLLAAGLLVFVDVLKELPATLLMRPFNFDTLAVRTYNLASDERLSDAAAPALAIVLVGLLPVLLLSRAIARSRPGASSSSRS